MLNLDDKLLEQDDLLMGEIEAALVTLPLRDAPSKLTTTALLAVSEYEQTASNRFEFWAWLDNAIMRVSSPLALIIGGLVAVSFYLFVFSTSTWQTFAAGVERSFSTFAASVGSFFNNSLALPALVAVLLLIAVVALTPRVREVRAVLRAGRQAA